jgi:hypothetical protein
MQPSTAMRRRDGAQPSAAWNSLVANSEQRGPSAPASVRRKGGTPMQRRIRLVVLVSALMLVASAATADDVGLIGSVARLEMNTSSADTYLQYHGRMFVKNENGTLDEYRWGGTSCGSRVLVDAQFAVLQAAQNNKKMLVEPLSQDGQGNTKCLVGIRMVEKKNLKLFP